jgi:hypothetical protein
MTEGAIILWSGVGICAGVIFIILIGPPFDHYFGKFLDWYWDKWERWLK